MNTLMMRVARASQAGEAGKGTPLPIIAATKGRKMDGVDLADLPWDFSRGVQGDDGRYRFPMLWAHDLSGQRLPIGVVDVGVGSDSVSLDDSAAIFDPEDPFAVTTERKFRSPVGGLSGFSITWDDVDAAGLPARSTGNKAVAHQLWEVSAVPVPLDALSTKRGLDGMRALQRDIEAILEGGLSDEPAEDPATTTDNTAERSVDALTDDTDEAEADALAAEMVAVFTPSADDSDESRQRRYRALQPAYRRLGWTAPEWVDSAELAALAPDVRASLFVSGELTRGRAGKELSGANVAALSDALDGIEAGAAKLRALLDRAAGERAAKVDTPATDAPVDELNTDDAADSDSEFLRALAKYLGATETTE